MKSCLIVLFRNNQALLSNNLGLIDNKVSFRLNAERLKPKYGSNLRRIRWV